MDTRTELNVLSICSGYGGIELGLDAALAGRTRTICYVENEISVAAILAARMEDGSIDPAPIWTDLTTFDPEPWRGKVDILAGGFPCQPFSFAGKRLQSADERNLWPDVARIIDGIKPDGVFVENVSGILRYHHERIRRDLREMAYEVAEGLFTATETGAPHRRERLFILAHRDGEFSDILQRPARAEPHRGGNELAHAAEQGLQAGEPSGLGGSPTAQSQRRDQPTTKSMHSYPQELAHADSGTSIQSELQKGSGYALRDDGELAHADGLGHVHEQPGVEPDHRGLDAQRHAAEGGGELADTEGQRQRESDDKATTQCAERQTREIASRRGWRMGGELADTGGEGLQRVRFAQQGEYAPGPGDVPLYPPAPNDHAGWEWLLARWPELAPTYCKDGHDVQPEVPAIESKLRGASHGTPTGVDRRLRAIGNGVVPAVAAVAFRTLARDMRRMIN